MTTTSDDPIEEQPKGSPPARDPQSEEQLKREGEDFNVNNRDPYNMNPHLRVTFNDLIGEPEKGMYSDEGMYVRSFEVFTATRNGCYNLLTLICALPVSFCLGINFACLQFQYIWCLQPNLKAFDIVMVYHRKVYSTVVKTFLVPMYSAVGYVFSKIRITKTDGGKAPDFIETV